MLARQAQELAKDLGFANGVEGREYFISSNGGKYRFLLARAKDIPLYVAQGVADIGITGGDLVAETGANVRQLTALPFGECRLVYAVKKESDGSKPSRVATAFPNLTRSYLSSRAIDATVVCLGGAIEASIAAGIADAIVDLSSTGRTLEANGLIEVGEVMRSSAVVIANENSMKNNGEEVEQALVALKGSIVIFKGKLTGLATEEKKRLIYRGRKNSAEAREVARAVFDWVLKERDEALSYYAQEFDGVKLSPRQFAVTAEEIKEAYSLVGEEVIDALKTCAENIARFSRKELPQRFEIKVEGGSLGKRIVPLDSVGVYAPGGLAAYPSSVLMGVIPAKIAGVEKIILCTPCNKERKCNPAVLVAADIAGATEIIKLGGAQAIAAMAIGTREVCKAMKIVGPGNAFVANAKLEAVSRGLASIDSPAGPSELLIIADLSAKASFVAAEMLAQAEHGPDAAVVTLVTSEGLIAEIENELVKQAALMPRREIIRKSIAANGALLAVEDINEAIDFANEYGPEHLSLMVQSPFSWMEKVRNAGAIFAGNYSCVAAGDYAAGTNHVLPTGGTAKFYSGLSAGDFVRQVNYVKLEKNGLAAISKAIVTVAQAEGLQAHAASVTKRFEENE
ncbi:histidinol dehydrogenase [Candidatus Micrarchaeota archaeon]|nr:histidinol dehydrogenase [Candidatus Micrarchaeota archaeon]